MLVSCTRWPSIRRHNCLPPRRDRPAMCLTCAARDRRPAMIEQRRPHHREVQRTVRESEWSKSTLTSLSSKDESRREGALRTVSVYDLYLNKVFGARSFHHGGLPPTFVEGALKPLLRAHSFATSAHASRCSHVRCIASLPNHAHKRMPHPR